MNLWFNMLMMCCTYNHRQQAALSVWALTLTQRAESIHVKNNSSAKGKKAGSPLPKKKQQNIFLNIWIFVEKISVCGMYWFYFLAFSVRLPL